MSNGHAHFPSILYTIVSPAFDVWSCGYHMQHYISICCFVKCIFDFSYLYSLIGRNMSVRHSRYAQLIALYSPMALYPLHSKKINYDHVLSACARVVLKDWLMKNGCVIGIVLEIRQIIPSPFLSPCLSAVCVVFSTPLPSFPQCSIATQPIIHCCVSFSHCILSSSNK